MALRWDLPIHETAFKHGVRDADIRAALRTVVYENEQPHGTTIYLGYDSDLQLLEIGIAYDDDRNGLVIHAMQAQQEYIDDYRDHRR